MNIKRRLVPAYEDSFYERFPNLFVDALVGKKSVSPLTEYGIECATGWRKLVEDLCARIEAAIVALPESQRHAYRATQIKQKMNELRFYMTRYTDEMTAAIADAEEECALVCELCGDRGCSGECRDRHKRRNA